MIRIREAVVVEGRYDRQKLRTFLDAPVLETSGFGIMNNKEQLMYLRRIALERGIVILTDSDGAGLVIRNYLRGSLPAECVKHAYIPQIAGKEKRKAHPGKEGLLGVEGMTEEVLLRALQRAGVRILPPETEEDPPQSGMDAPQKDPITHTDLYRLGYSGTAGSAARRAELCRALELPTHMSTSALLEALNLFCDRQTLEKLANQHTLDPSDNKKGEAQL